MASLSQQIEALLFVAGKPVSFTKLAVFCKSEPTKIKEEIKNLADLLKQGERGLGIIFNEIEASIVSSPDAGKTVQAFLKEEKEGKLSRAALETLAIISYRQPVTRPEIDIIRGVNSSIMLRALLLRGLIERRKSQKDQRMFEYILGFEFMKMLGISSKEELPDFETLKKSFTEKGLDKPNQQDIKDVRQKKNT